MQKKELKNGCVVQLRNGANYFKIDETLIEKSLSGWIDLNDYNEDLSTDEKEFDIVKVNNDVDCDNLPKRKTCFMAINSNINLKEEKWTWERKETVREKFEINEAERIILMNLNAKYKYVARDRDGGIYLYTEKPYKEGMSWHSWGDVADLQFPDLFKFVKWEDEEPYSIFKELLGRCL